MSIVQPLQISGANSGVHTGEVRVVYDRVCAEVPLTATNINAVVSGDSDATVAQPNVSCPESGDYVALGVHSRSPPGANTRFSRAAIIANELGGYPAPWFE
ncbi:hypothetical protein BJ980_000436 [Nocardioides daedukensis]|uniref:Uncharacterized protein n=1 Tax=Nocardioides daedukensis TaxID=634462 RepID=A0A7Y9RZH6_9ACTN|nr:hypothetical protein [Nocardioides daedukensis]NYG57513.1 hypothetical protein [Nocardioides daedukensis]